MSKTYRHQDRYNYLHENKEVPKNRLYKLLNWFNRINFWDWDSVGNSAADSCAYVFFQCGDRAIAGYF